MARGSAKTIGVFLAEDHEVVRQGIALLLEGAEDIEVVGEASDGWQTVEGVRRVRPDVVLMDIDMPGLSGVDATRRIVQASPEVSVLILTIYAREDLLSRSLEAGARGYVPKVASVDDLLTAIRTVHSGEVFIYPSMTTKLVDGYLRRMREGEGDDPYGKLSVRERQVLPMIAEGRAIHDIASELHISPYTVQTYRQRIMQKLDIHSGTELLIYALRRGLIHLEP